MASAALFGNGFSHRWFLYCRERFPLLSTAAAMAAFAFATLAVTASLVPAAFVAASAVAFLFFLQLRILDEFKDADDDAAFRPYRPVPRGLVSLRELGAVGLTAAGVQVALAAIAGTAALVALAATFAWMTLMAREFFVRRWLRAHPVAYLASHAMVMPLIATAIAAFGRPDVLGALPAPYLAFCVASATVVEIGRKIRAPADEARGVETYSALWGTRGSVIVWLLCVAVSAALAVASGPTHPAKIAALGVAMLIVAAARARRFLARPAPGTGRGFHALSGLWVLVAYVALGVAAMAGPP